MSFRPALSVARGRLRSGDERGTPVYAGAFLRERRIVLDSALRGRERKRILTHELYHFAWARMGNPLRREYEEQLRREWRQRARGEAGWSAQWRKEALTAGDATERTARWRQYVCESFCDTAAWLLVCPKGHPECTLAARFQEGRRDWWQRHIAGRVLSL